MYEIYLSIVLMFFPVLAITILVIHVKLKETAEELKRITSVMSHKEQWEFSEFEVQKFKSFYDDHYDFVKLDSLNSILNPIHTEIQVLKSKVKDKDDPS